MPDEAPVMTAVPLLSFVLIVLFLVVLLILTRPNGAGRISALRVEFRLVAYTTFAEIGICHYLVNGDGENYFWGNPAQTSAGKELIWTRLSFPDSAVAITPRCAAPRAGSAASTTTRWRL